MVFHSSSASLSSFPFSHASSSSLSSPPSSPASSQDSFAASSSLALVPFLWEEKPGVLKKAMQSSDGAPDLSRGEGSPPFSRDAHAHAQTRTCPSDSYVHSSERISRTFPASRSKLRSDSVPHLRPPPRLSQPNLHAYVQDEDDADNHHQWGTPAAVKSKVMSSFSFYKRRHHRAPSLEDDPFWMAMVACTDDEGKGRGSRMRFKGDRHKASGAMQRGDSRCAKGGQGHTIHFEQCMPRQTFASNTTSSKEKILGPNPLRSLKNEGAIRNQGQYDCADASMHSAHLASKAFKALNIAKSELHGRCKVLLQQQGSPVDISCSTRRSKRPSFASKRKLPDLFGCKSHHPLSNIPP